MSQLQYYIDQTVHEGAVQHHYPKDNVQITYFPNLNHAYVLHRNKTYWFEANGPHSAYEEFMSKEAYQEKSVVNI